MCLEPFCNFLKTLFAQLRLQFFIYIYAGDILYAFLHFLQLFNVNLWTVLGLK